MHFHISIHLLSPSAQIKGCNIKRAWTSESGIPGLNLRLASYSCVTLGKLLNLTVLLFPDVENCSAIVSQSHPENSMK